MDSRRADTAGLNGSSFPTIDVSSEVEDANSSITQRKESKKPKLPKLEAVREGLAKNDKRPKSTQSMGSSIGGSIYASTILSMGEDNSGDDAFLDGNAVLNDQQWVLQRKKIGLSRKTNRAFIGVAHAQSKTKNALSFVKSFRRKECVHFVPDLGRKTRPYGAGPGTIEESPCYCGAPEDQHKTRSTHIHESRFVPPLPTDTIFEEDEVLSTTSTIPIITIDVRTANEAISEFDPLDTPVSSTGPLRWNINNSLDEISALQNDLRLALKTPTLLEMPIHPSQTKTLTPKVKDWDDETHVQEFTTNAFGQVDFISDDEGSIKPAKYIRLSDTTPMHKVKELLIDHWGLFRPHRPHLAISLIGGAKNFRMEGRKRETFKAGLIKAAKSTNALILTGGTNAGTMKLVGDAVRDGQFMVQDGDKLVRGLKLLGLCSWGYIKNNDVFINKNNDEFNYCRYDSNVEVKHGDNVPLNGDHTHFIMIDDGSRYRFFGKSTDFITRFETMIRDEEPKGLGIPIVTLLLEGGKDAIRIVKDRLREGIACVAIEGSGRAADIISYAYKNAVKNKESGKYSLKEGHLAELYKMIDEAYGKYLTNPTVKDKEMKTVMNWLIECVRYSDIITTFDIRRETSLDKKILSALLKGHDMPLHHQLYLAMVWDRVDIAEEKILINETGIDRGGLDDIMLQSLLNERVEFIELLFANGFLLKNFLNVEKLKVLYNEAARKNKELLYELRYMLGINTKEIHLRHIDKFLVHLMKEHDNQLYRYDSRKYNFIEQDETYFEEVYIELFIWALLSNKSRLVDFFWTRCSQPLLMAIIGSAIASRLALFYANKNTDAAAVKKELKTLFQERANKLVGIAFAIDSNKCMSLLEKRNKRWGDRNLMELGYIGHLRTFIANRSCQLVTQSAWRRGFTRLPWFACPLCMFMPFLVWSPLVRFQPGLGDDGGDLNPFQKLYVFYRAPIVKYTGSCLSFVALLLLYSFVSIYGYRYDFQTAEIVLYVWFVILILDECRQIAIEPSKSARGKFGDYFDSVWNKFDAAIYLVGIFTFILKNFESTFWLSRIFFAINGAFLYVRVFRIYHASYNLGPKLVIFHRMIPEIVTFLLLLSVFILAYGVSSQAIIEPYREFTLDSLGPLLFNIFFLPYWQMYGELQLESIAVRDTTHCSNQSVLLSTPNFNESQVCLEPGIDSLEDYNYVIPIFLSVYLLIGNVMLLNLLIAIFTSVFEEVHENSKDVWKWEMYRLVTEYDKWPGLAPPFVIIEDIFTFFKSIWKVTCRKKKEDLDVFMKETVETLRLFERDCMVAFMSDEFKNKEESIERKLFKLEEKSQQILEIFEESPDDLANWGDAISLEQKLYKSSSDDDSDEEVLNEGGKKSLNFIGLRNAPSARGGSKSGKKAHELEQEIKSIRIQLEKMEKSHFSEMKSMEEQLKKTQDAIEVALKTMTEKVYLAMTQKNKS